MYLVDQLGMGAAGDIMAWIYVKCVYRRGDDHVGLKGYQLFAMFVDLMAELEHGEHTFPSVALIFDGRQPQIVDAFKAFPSNRWLCFAKVREGGSHYCHLMAHPHPLAGHIIGAILHAILRRSGVVAYHQDIHRKSLITSNDSAYWQPTCTPRVRASERTNSEEV